VTTKSIPKDVKTAVLNAVAEFNSKNFGDWEIGYIARFQGHNIYLDWKQFRSRYPICRLTFFAKPNGLEFAIFKYSTRRYSPDECFFPGDDEVNGTIEGAMRAGMKAYPVQGNQKPNNVWQFTSHFSPKLKASVPASCLCRIKSSRLSDSQQRTVKRIAPA
jgi:hypothetical protein